MISPILRFIFPFLIPFIGYFIWLKIMRVLGKERTWSHPWHWLFLAGTLGLLVMFAVFAQEGAPAGSIYVPPVYKDGKIIPGHHLPMEHSKP